MKEDNKALTRARRTMRSFLHPVKPTGDLAEAEKRLAAVTASAAASQNSVSQEASAREVSVKACAENLTSSMW